MRRRHVILPLAALLLAAGGCARWCPGGASVRSHEQAVVHHHHVLNHHDPRPPLAPIDRGDRHSRDDSARTASDRGSRYGDSSNNDPAARQRTRD